MMVLVIGVVAVGIAKRCEWLGICNTGASGPPAVVAAAPDDAVEAADDGKADDSDNGKKKKCGCCNCVQNSKNEIVCDTGAGSVKFTSGLSLDAQCNACADDDSICKNAKAAQKAADDARKAANEKANNDKVTKSGSVRCQDGASLKNGVCVRNNPKPKATPKPNSVVDGCPKGTFRDCGPPIKGSNIIACKCSKSKVQYANVVSGYYSSTALPPTTSYYSNNNYHINKFSRIAI